jgi:hypothetical protein
VNTTNREAIFHVQHDLLNRIEPFVVSPVLNQLPCQDIRIGDLGGGSHINLPLSRNHGTSDGPVSRHDLA